MAEKPVTTNAMRLLKAARIAFEVRTYEVDESDLSGVSVARKCGLPAQQVFKTLLLKGERHGPLVCVLPVEKEVDLKKLAALAGEKKVELAPLKELTPLTGYIRGGCSPIGMKKKYPTFLDESCREYEAIAVSAGMRGAQIVLPAEDLIRYTGAKVASVAQ